MRTQDHDTTAPACSRRRFLGATSMFALGAIAGAGLGAGVTVAIALRPDAVARARMAVLPREGRSTGIVFDTAVSRLIEGGAIAPDKIRALYQARNTDIPAWVGELLDGEPGSSEIVFTSDTVPHLLTLLWPMGLATRAAFNDSSPIAGAHVNEFASTGGWPLGQEDTGGVYFNSVDTVALDGMANDLVLGLAERIHRPCCDNSTFFQDCNHGSALLGLLELGAAQGLDEKRLANAALAASAFWFPDQMTEVALHREIIEESSFAGTPALDLIGPERFSMSGWLHNIHRPLAQSGMLPSTGSGQAGCGA